MAIHLIMLFALSLLILLLLFLVTLDLIRSEDYMLDLETRGYQEREWPSISIVVAARNEQDSIESATLSLLRQEYPKYELIVVNDRSTDLTGEILQTLQQTHSELKSIAIVELPEGWLGKCNAMHQGAMAATGDWLLFTDADVSMRPDTLKVTIDYALAEKADHLTMAPNCEMPSWLLRAFVATFAFFFKLHVKPAQISNPRSKAHVGRVEVTCTFWGIRIEEECSLGIISSSCFRQKIFVGDGCGTSTTTSTSFSFGR